MLEPWKEIAAPDLASFVWDGIIGGPARIVIQHDGEGLSLTRAGALLRIQGFLGTQDVRVLPVTQGLEVPPLGDASLITCEDPLSYSHRPLVDEARSAGYPGRYRVVPQDGHRLTVMEVLTADGEPTDFGTIAERSSEHRAVVFRGRTPDSSHRETLIIVPTTELALLAAAQLLTDGRTLVGIPLPDGGTDEPLEMVIRCTAEALPNDPLQPCDAVVDHIVFGKREWGFRGSAWSLTKPKVRIVKSKDGELIAILINGQAIPHKMDSDRAVALEYLAERCEQGLYSSKEDVARKLAGPKGNWRMKLDTAGARLSDIKGMVGAAHMLEKTDPQTTTKLYLMDVHVLRNYDVTQ